MVKQRKKEAVAYCRVSSKGQQKNGTGLDRQEEIIATFAKKIGCKIIQWYKEAYTGTEENRPEFTQMLVILIDQQMESLQTVCMEELC